MNLQVSHPKRIQRSIYHLLLSNACLQREALTIETVSKVSLSLLNCDFIVIIFMEPEQVAPENQKQRHNYAFENCQVTVEQIRALNLEIKQVEFENCTALPRVWIQILKVLSERKQMNQLSFNDCFLGVYQFQKELERLQHVKTLVMINCRLNSQVVRSIKTLVGISELCLSQNHIGQNIKELASLVNLEILDISGCSTAGCEMSFLKDFKSLVCLIIDGCHLPVVEHLTNLKKLGLYMRKDDSCENLQNLTKLKILYLWGEVSQAFFHSICSLTDINDLTLYTSDQNKSQIINIDWKHLRKLQKLTQFTTSYQCTLQTAKALSDLPQLNELFFFGIRQFGNTNVIGNEECKAISQIKTLKQLIFDSYYIGDNEVEHLSALANLHTLQISNGANIGPVGAGNLTKLKNIRTLCLLNNAIGNQGAKAISKMDSLNILNLTKNRIEAEGVAALARLVNLDGLDLNRNPLGNEGAFQIRKLTKLSKICITDCKIDANGVHFLERITHLKDMVSMPNNKIHIFTICQLKRRKPKTNIYIDED